MALRQLLQHAVAQRRFVARRRLQVAEFETAFGRWELGYASAAAELLFLIILAVTITQYWATGRATGAQGGR